MDLIGNEKTTTIYNSDEGHYLKSRGYFLELIIHALQPTIEQIHLSRILKKSWISSMIEEKKESQVTKPLQKRSSKSVLETRSTIAVMTPAQKDFFKKMKEMRRKLRKAEKDSQ